MAKVKWKPMAPHSRLVLFIDQLLHLPTMTDKFNLLAILLMY